MRPKSAAHRTSRLVFRVYSLEKKAIELAAEKSGLSMSDYIRRCCLGQTVRHRLNQEEFDIYRLLVEYRNNFSRIRNLVKGREDITNELKNVIQTIDEHLKKFNP
jgi:hypothetical protein